MSRPLIAHQVEGEGPPLLLLNGGMMTYASWEPVAAVLRERWQVLRCDFRGQLLSPAAPGEGDGSLAGHAEDLLALLEARGWEKAHVVGTSFGAEVSLELASRHPQRFRSLTLITAMDRETPEFRRGNQNMQGILQSILAGGPRQPFWDALLAEVYSAGYLAREAEIMAARASKIDVLPPAYFAGIGRILREISGFDFSGRLARWPFPALVVIAGDDQVMAEERSRALAAAVGAEIAVHPTAGHGLVAEEPEWLAAICHEFLERVDASQASGG